MAAKLPYMLSTGLVPKILGKIQEARRPERFTQDFLETKLGHRGGSARAVIPLLKRMGFLGSDGIPTPLYDQFRNPATQGHAVAKGMKQAFVEIFERNEYAYELSRERLTGLIVEITGSEKSDRNTQATVGTFLALSELADFEGQVPEPPVHTSPNAVTATDQDLTDEKILPARPAADNVGLHVGYTINLNLPETNDPDVFNAIFKALRENLLRN